VSECALLRERRGWILRCPADTEGAPDATEVKFRSTLPSVSAQALPWCPQGTPWSASADTAPALAH